MASPITNESTLKPPEQHLIASSFIREEFMSERELALALGKTVRTLHRWHAERTGPTRTLAGRAVLYARKNVQQWMESQEQRPCRTARGRR
jgi:predicted DNA-binding transcriptional regulator AlpA